MTLRCADSAHRTEASDRLHSFLSELDHHLSIPAQQQKEIEKLFFQRISTIQGISTGEPHPSLQASQMWKRTNPILKYEKLKSADRLLIWVSILLDCIASRSPSQREQIVHTLVDDFSLTIPVKNRLYSFGVGESQAWFEISMLVFALVHQTIPQSPEKDLVSFWSQLFSDRMGRVILGVNESQGFSWVRQESIQRLLHWFTVLDLLRFPEKTEDWNQHVEYWITDLDGIDKARKALINSGCRVDLFLDSLAG